MHSKSTLRYKLFTINCLYDTAKSYTILLISVFSCLMMRFSNREMYDWDIPRQSATCFCVFSFWPFNPKRISMIIFSRSQSLAMHSFIKSFSTLPSISVYTDVRLRAEYIGQQKLVTIPVHVERFRRTIPHILFWHCAEDTSVSRSRYNATRRSQA